MTKKISTVLCVAIALGCANAQAAKYPAGVNPNLCPNYPHCGNAAFGAATSATRSASHAYSAPVYGGYSAPRNTAPKYAAPEYATPVYATPEHVPVRSSVLEDGYPADVSPHSCPNYPFCGATPVHNPEAAPAAYAYEATPGDRYSSLADDGDRYPAGVSSDACPNYPYCH